MKPKYSHPEVHITQLASMPVMQVASPASPVSGAGQVNVGIPTDDQW